MFILIVFLGKTDEDKLLDDWFKRMRQSNIPLKSNPDYKQNFSSSKEITGDWKNQVMKIMNILYQFYEK